MLDGRRVQNGENLIVDLWIQIIKLNFGVYFAARESQTLGMLNATVRLRTSMGKTSSVDREPFLPRLNRRGDVPNHEICWWKRPMFLRVVVALTLSGLLIVMVSRTQVSTILPAVSWFRSSTSGSSSVQSGFAIAAACRNRHDALKRSLPSWLLINGISEIVIVDWSSSPPLASTVQKILRTSANPSSPSVRLIRIDGEPEWVLSRAYNVAFNQTHRSIVAKLDCDYIVKPELFDAHEISTKSAWYYTGYYMNSRTPNEVHLNGALLVRRDHFKRVGGYDERIQTYGYDDEDLYSRLENLNIERRNVSYDYIGHISHRDAVRKQSSVPFPRVQIEFNKMLVRSCSTKWSRFMRHSEYIPNSKTNNTGLIADYIPKPIQKWFNSSFLHEKWRISLGARLNNGYSLPWAMITSLNTESLQKLLRNLQNRQAKLNKDEVLDDGIVPRMFIVHVQNGLGNRLRALGSALDFANKTNRELVIIWEEDEHLQAPMSAVFDISQLPYAVMDKAEFNWPLEGWRKYDKSWYEIEAYNYMLPGGKDILVKDDSNKNIYFKSAFAMKSRFTTWESENKRLRELPVRENILELVRVATDSHQWPFGGVHIRNRSLSEDIKNLKNFEKEYGKNDTLLLEKWRSRTSYHAFIPEMRRLLKDGTINKFFVATDTIEVVSKLGQALGTDKLFYIKRSCDDRSSTCIKYAMADILVLAKSKLFLGSTWSSFSEAAMRFGAPKASLAGTDF